MIHKVYRSENGSYFACHLSVGRGTEGWEAVTCPACRENLGKAPLVSAPLDYALSSLRRAAEQGHPWSVSPSEAAALVVEVERLRAEVEALRTERTLRAFDATTAAFEERAAVVVYLRGLADDYGVCLDLSLAEQADIIERGEHRREEEP